MTYKYCVQGEEGVQNSFKTFLGTLWMAPKTVIYEWPGSSVCSICDLNCYPLGTRRKVNVSWTSYLGPSDENYWVTLCERKISASYKRHLDIIRTILLRRYSLSKDVHKQMLFERYISTSFGRVSLIWRFREVNSTLCQDIDWTFKTDVI